MGTIQQWFLLFSIGIDNIKLLIKMLFHRKAKESKMKRK